MRIEEVKRDVKGIPVVMWRVVSSRRALGPLCASRTRALVAWLLPDEGNVFLSKMLFSVRRWSSRLSERGSPGGSGRGSSSVRSERRGEEACEHGSWSGWCWKCATPGIEGDRGDWPSSRWIWVLAVVVLACLLVLAATSVMSGCSGRAGAGSWSVSEGTLRVEPGRKVVGFAWRGDVPCLLTRAALPGETAETFRIDEFVEWYRVDRYVDVVEQYSPDGGTKR